MKTLVKLSSLWRRFRDWRWYWPAIAGIALALALPAYLVAAQLGAVPPDLKPSVVLPNPIAAISKAAVSAVNTATGHKPASDGANQAKPSSSPKALGASTSKPGSPTAGASTPSGTPGHQLILTNPVLTIGNGSQSDPDYRPHTQAYVTSRADLHNFLASGSHADIGIVSFHDSQGCPPYSSMGSTEWCTIWDVSAMRSHPEGSGTSYFTITASDHDGNVYSAQLTVKWPPIAFYKISNVSASIGSGVDGLGSPVTAIILDFDLTSGPNFGTHRLTMTETVNWPYDCASAPGYSETVSYGGGLQHYQLKCGLVGDLNQERSYGGTVGVNIQSDLFSDFQTQGASATVPKW